MSNTLNDTLPADQVLRVRALELAIDFAGVNESIVDDTDVVSAAKTFADFVLGKPQG